MFDTVPPDMGADILSSLDTKMMAALNVKNYKEAGVILTRIIHTTVGDKRSWDSPQYLTSRRIQDSIVQNKDRDSKLTFFALDTLRDRYFLRDTNNVICETPQDFFARVATGVAVGGHTAEEVEGSKSLFKETQEFAQELYELLSNLHALFATPILTNIGTNRGLPVSCFLGSSDDSIIGIYDTYKENAILAQGGGGIGTYWGNLREEKAKLSRGGTSSGPIPFLKTKDSSTAAVHQAGARRGAAAAYMQISHPDIEDFIDIRKNTGDLDRRTQNLHHGICVTDAFMAAVEAKGKWDLVSPKTGKVVRTVDAAELMRKIITTRAMTGEPYILNIDTVNRAQPEAYKQLGMPVETSNLCVAPETNILTRGGDVAIASLENQVVEVWNGEEWSWVTVRKTATNATLLRVTLEVTDAMLNTSYSIIDCTPEHQFWCQDSMTSTKHLRMRPAAHLEPGHRLATWSMPDSSGNSVPDTRSISVFNIEHTGRISDTFCFTEPKKNLGTFNGVVTGQCVEITIPCTPGAPNASVPSTSLGRIQDSLFPTLNAARTAVCCLGSVNYATYGEWLFKAPEVIYLMTKGLDNVLDAFIRFAGDREGYEKSTYAAYRGRDIGLGVMGWFDYLQQRSIPFESIEARSHNRMRFKEFGQASDAASRSLAAERGLAPDALACLPIWKRVAVMALTAVAIRGPGLRQRLFERLVPTPLRYRNLNRQAIAPTASIGIIAGSSPCIEPPTGNAYTQKTMSGSFAVRNQQLDDLLVSKYPAYANEETWTSIASTEGSVQHLEWMSLEDRKVFKTASELNQRELVQQAADRQPWISQAQSLNLFFAPGESGTLSAKYLWDVHMMAHRLGVKSLYYARMTSVLRAKTIEPGTGKRINLADQLAYEECTVCQ